MNKFNRNDSKTLKVHSTSDIKVSYGSGDIWGHHASENVCLSQAGRTKSDDICVNDFSILLVNDQNGLSGLIADGIIGLSPTTFGSSKSDLFIDRAFEQGAIDEKVFSLLIGSGYQESVMTVGGYDLSKYA